MDVEGMTRGSYWRWQKEDFFPGQSFESCASYTSALFHTPSRLRDRLLTRSRDADELTGARRRSEHDMRRCLTWWDLIWFGFGSVVGAGVFVLTGQEARNHAGPAIVLSYAASGFSALLSVFCYTEFAVEIPAAGGSFAYLRVELGDFVAFIAAGNLILESVVGCAAVARAWTSYLAALLGRAPNSLRIHTSLADGFNLLDPISVAVIAATAGAAIASTKKSSLLNWVASILHVAVILFVIIASFARGHAGNMTPFAPYGASGVFRAAAVVYFAYGGFDRAATLAEEVRNPSRDIPIGLIGSLSGIITIYCLMALSLAMLQRYTDIDPNAAFSMAFRSVGMGWAATLVALGALKGMTTVLLVGAITKARYVTHIARAHMIPPLFALVHPWTGTPIYATMLVGTISACFAFFSSLSVLSSLLSISYLFVFMMVALALLVRRYYDSAAPTARTDRIKLTTLLLLVMGSSVATAAYWGLSPHGSWVGYVVTVPLWTAGTAGMAVLLPQRRTPKVWGVPMVPWLPSLSIAMNIFLMGSLGYQAFVRFGVCTLVMLVYYLFFGLHSTYDMAHEEGQSPKKPNRVEDGDGF
ncbi:hypothetical protein Taro_045960 [Colocasia esculenta]|uniref:Cationic amino acid transporter C-terminal domain-containing protein n=1 Tax=Colocasia esculenta TaxID=4460 RepID=A0A843X1A2_COLES|nr:hypothetical protein [Colocasia esculenta]